MKTKWDYTNLAKSYLKRPDYSDEAIDEMFSTAGLQPGDLACDVGAGVAHLTLKLHRKGLHITCVEPNDEMRKYGQQRTGTLANITWHEGTGEDTGQAANTFDIVTFGSSFNVTDRTKSMVEAARILKDRGWFAIMWNHRDLSDPVQEGIEQIIKTAIPEYGYGTRREDQTDILEESGLFRNIFKIEGNILHRQTRQDVVEAWKSHATLYRQAGALFPEIIENIGHLLSDLPEENVIIPYITRLWLARLK